MSSPTSALEFDKIDTSKCEASVTLEFESEDATNETEGEAIGVYSTGSQPEIPYELILQMKKFEQTLVKL